MSWIAGIFEIIGGVLLGNKDRNGFVFNIFGCFIWIVIGVKNIKNPDIAGILLVVVPMFFINIINFIKWRNAIEKGKQI